MLVLLLVAACGGSEFDETLDGDAFGVDEAEATSSTVMLNEFSTGSAGWIELYNSGAKARTITGWSVSSAALAPRLVPAGTSIPAKGRVVIPYAALTTASAWIFLRNDKNKVVDSTVYPDATSAACRGRFPDGASWVPGPLASCTRGSANVGAPAPGRCGAGTWGNVSFTVSEACKAIDFVNKAPYRLLSRVGDGEARIAYDCTPDGTCGERAGRWTSLAELSRFQGSARACAFLNFNGLKLESAVWNGQSLTETVATVWRDRASLGMVTLEHAYVAQAIPGQTAEQRGCAIIKDNPNGTAWIKMCDWVNRYADSWGQNYSGHVGTYLKVRGYVRYDRFLNGGAAWAVEEQDPAATKQCGAFQFTK